MQDGLLNPRQEKDAGKRHVVRVGLDRLAHGHSGEHLCARDGSLDNHLTPVGGSNEELFAARDKQAAEAKKERARAEGLWRRLEASGDHQQLCT
jgi:hypothetical protein